MTVACRGVDDPPRLSDGHRYLIEREWPARVLPTALHLAGWLKELAPSPGLCAWFGRDTRRFPTFRFLYRRELLRHLPVVSRLAEESVRRRITLLFIAHELDHSAPTVLKEFIEEQREIPLDRGFWTYGADAAGLGVVGRTVS